MSIATTGRRGGLWPADVDELIEELRRERVRRAAIEVVGEVGYIPASIPAICKAAGMSFRTFRRLYSGGKEEAFLDAYERAAGDVLRSSAAVYRDAPGELRARVRAGVEHALTMLSEDPLFARAVIVQAPAAGRALLEARSLVSLRLASWLDDAMGREAPAGSVTVAGEFAVGGALSLLYTCVAMDRMTEMPDMIEAIVGLLVQDSSPST